MSIRLKVTGSRRISGEVVSDIFDVESDEEALAMFHAVYGPMPAPYTELSPDWAEAFAIDYV